MNASRESAKHLLRHYLRLAGAPVDGDCEVEIGEIVDHIVTAAVEEAKAAIIRELRAVEVRS